VRLRASRTSATGPRSTSASRRPTLDQTTPSIVVLLDELCRRGVVLDAGRAQFVRALTTAGQGGPTHANDDYGNGMTSRRRDRAFARSEVLLEFLRTIDTTPASTAERIRGRRGLA